MCARAGQSGASRDASTRMFVQHPGMRAFRRNRLSPPPLSLSPPLPKPRRPPRTSCRRGSPHQLRRCPHRLQFRRRWLRGVAAAGGRASKPPPHHPGTSRIRSTHPTKARTACAAARDRGGAGEARVGYLLRMQLGSAVARPKVSDLAVKRPTAFELGKLECCPSFKCAAAAKCRPFLYSLPPS